VIRWISVVPALLAVAWGQSPTPAPLVARTTIKAGDTEMVSPAAISPGDEGASRPVLDIPPLPKGKATLIGGTIYSVDHVRDRMVLQVFAGRRMSLLFDERTRLLRDGKVASLEGLKNGERAYVDTTLDGSDIFVRSIRIGTAVPSGQSSGQVVSFDNATGELSFRDTLSPEPVTMRLAADTRILSGDHTVAPTELRPGALVALTFDPTAGRAPVVRQISILASPGTTFVFVGRIEHIDLRRGLLVLVDPRDNKNYDLYFDPAARGVTRDLKQGTNVTVQANFDGTRYQTRDIMVYAPSSQ
jgi:hypothetical protein